MPRRPKDRHRSLRPVGFRFLTRRGWRRCARSPAAGANKEIAGHLAISENTVKDHRKNILAKLQVAARTEAVTVAIQRGIIELLETRRDAAYRPSSRS